MEVRLLDIILDSGSPAGVLLLLIWALHRGVLVFGYRHRDVVDQQRAEIAHYRAMIERRSVLHGMAVLPTGDMRDTAGNMYADAFWNHPGWDVAFDRNIVQVSEVIMPQRVLVSQGEARPGLEQEQFWIEQRMLPWPLPWYALTSGWKEER